MQIKWSFTFDSEHIPYMVTDEEEDSRIEEALEANPPFLCLKIKGHEVFINLSHCKCITREVIDETAAQ